MVTRLPRGQRLEPICLARAPAGGWLRVGDHVFTRFRSRQDNPLSERMLAALRNQFGGHAVKTSS